MSMRCAVRAPTGAVSTLASEMTTRPGTYREPTDAAVFADAVISYEPIWAIGTGLAATPEQAKTMHKFIRNKVANLNLDAANRLKILYGGSVNPQNAVQLFLVENIDGGLIGKCSLNAQEFAGICQVAETSVV